MATVATVRTAALDELLTTKAQATVSAVACLHAYRCFVDKFHGLILVSDTKNPAQGGAVRVQLWERLLPRIPPQFVKTLTN